MNVYYISPLNYQLTGEFRNQTYRDFEIIFKKD